MEIRWLLRKLDLMNKIFLLLLFTTFNLVSQTYLTRTGSTEFKASVDAFEPIKASNNSTTVILKTNSGDLAAQLFITAFKFKVALMQEHFNENYMDTNEYPKAIFIGNLNNFNLSKISEVKQYSLSGKLMIRGIEKEISTIANVNLDDEKIIISATFSVSPQDFNIKIPYAVRKKIANKINISLKYELTEKK